MKMPDHHDLKRMQNDYSLSFKLEVVKEVESGSISNRAAMRDYVIQGHGTITDWRRRDAQTTN